MSVFMTEDDFAAICLADPDFREVALDDAWRRFATYKGSVRDFLKEAKTSTDLGVAAPHWWGAASSKVEVDDPVLTSITAQAAYAREHGEEATRLLLAENDLKLGQVRKPAPKDYSKSNPYAPNPGNPAARMDAIIALLKSGSPTLINSLAKSQNCTIDGKPLARRG